MSTIFPYSTKVTRCDTGGIELEENYDLRLCGEGAKKMINLAHISEQGAGVYFLPDLPSSWVSMTQLEKQEFVDENEFDIRVEGIYFRSRKTVTTMKDIKGILNYTEMKGLHIYENNNLDQRDIELLMCLTNLDHFLIRGKQFTDDIVDYFKEFNKMRNLDLFDTSITADGIKTLKLILPKQCKIYGP